MGNTDRQAQFSAATDRQDPPLWEIKLRPHRSLSNRGFAFVILLTAGALSIPMFAFLGTLAVWGLLPYAALAVFMLWTAIRASDRDGTLTEHLQLWPDLIAVHRMNPRKPDQYWCANPYWVTAHIQQTRDTKDYLTLKGAGREIELGRFLTPEDRTELFAELNKRLGEAAVPSGI